MKVAMIVAVGNMDPIRTKQIEVTKEDALAAIKLCRKFVSWAIKFVYSLGKNEQEDAIMRVLAFMQYKEGKVQRWQVSRKMSMSKRQLDELQFTLIDRGLIDVVEEKKEGSRKTSLFWALREAKHEPDGFEEAVEEQRKIANLQ